MLEIDKIDYRETTSLAYIFPGQGTQTNHSLDQRSVQLEVVSRSSLLLDSYRQSYPLVAAIKPKAFAGHSVGMWSAIYAAGMIEYPDLLQVVKRRAALMETIGPGKMAAIVGHSWYEAAQIWSEKGVSLAAINCPGQFVISGRETDVDNAAVLARQRGIRVLNVKAAGANHSNLMEPVQDQFRKYVGRLDLKPPAGFIMLNTSGLSTDSVSVVREELVAHLSQTVQWEQAVRNMVLMGINTFVEWGSDTLSKFIKRIDSNVTVISIMDEQQAKELTFKNA